MAQPQPESHATLGPEARLSRLEAQVATLAEAVRVLARGLENIPSEDVPPEEAARGARLAHELLLSQGL
ncbi:hypothetical protein [Streptomyces chromofuscus]|uniref:Uncharacterized protein n=1 Tax=Streptomyces chromofuscus TaxID=42881 RepID=A0A7M2TI49_STRCW|nr:hypothetical protein [Streptomyces chromofuscus]QOV47904.1 hypothetical protein IPT68_01345 [Streptomyces chromofuscus]GGT00929.1 hypothetical protein GCM10010254_21440 [Streptomyces chromofuscus]